MTEYTFSSQTGRVPPVLYLQMDNCARENKNQFVFALLSLLVEIGVFEKVILKSYQGTTELVKNIIIITYFIFSGHGGGGDFRRDSGNAHKFDRGSGFRPPHHDPLFLIKFCHRYVLDS